MIRNYFFKKSKIILAILIALFFTKFFSHSIFLANTPKINQNLLKNLINYPKNFLASLSFFYSRISEFNLITLRKSELNSEKISFEKNLNNRLKFEKNENNKSEISVDLFKEIVPGVKAHEDKNNKFLYIIYEKDVEFEKKIFTTSDGETIEFYIPQGLVN